MATAQKHKERSRSTNHRDLQGRLWFFNLTAFMAKNKAAKKKHLKEMLSNAKA